MNTNNWIRTVYLYLITTITIIMTIVAVVNIVKMGLEYAFDVKDWEEINVQYECQDGWAIQNGLSRAVPKRLDNDTEPTFTQEEKAKCIVKAEEKSKITSANNKKRDIIWSLAMLIVALPLFLYHWKVIQKEN